MHAMSARKGSALKFSSSKLANAAAAVIEPLECRALLSAGSVLHTEFTDVAGHSDSGGAVVAVGQKLLQVGFSYDAASKPVLSVARFNHNGTPDSTFGALGSNVVTNSLPDPYKKGAVNAAAVDPTSGRIIIVGRVDSASGSDFFVAAFQPDGQLDGGFGSGGVAIGSFFAGRDTEARALALGGDGSVFVAGGAISNQDLFSLARFNADGTLDDKFANHGIAQAPSLEDPTNGTDSVDTVHAIAIDSNNNIILAGYSLARFNAENAFVITLQRYLPTGEIDASLGAGGSVRFDVPATNATAVGDKAFSVTVDQLGRILVGGTTDGPLENHDSFVLLRFESSGKLDASFNSSEEPGIARFYFGGFSSALISDIAIQSDGAILAAGNVFNCTDDSCGDGENNFAIARYDGSGLLDSTFGAAGVVLTQNFKGGPAENNLATLALQSDASGNPTLALGSWVNADIPLDGSLPIHSSDDLVLVRFDLTGARVNLTGPATANEGDNLVFNASFSGGIAMGVNFSQSQHRANGTASPAPSTTVSYDWTIKVDGADGVSTLVVSGSGTATDTLAIPFTPPDNGLYHVVITIDGGADSNSADVDVANVAPTAAITLAPPTGLEGSAITLGSTVSDPGSADTHKYAWSVTKNGAPFTTGDAATFTFTPDDNGDYVVTLTVTDDDLGAGIDSKTIVVSNVDPTASISGAPDFSPEGTAIHLIGIATDPGSAEALSYAWSVNGSLLASGSDSTFSFTPADNGSYEVTLTVTDKDGGTAGSSSTLEVTNVSPVAAIHGAQDSSPEGTAINLTSTASDPGSVDTFTYAWSVTKDGSAYASGSAASFSFTPNDNGSYVVSLTVTDDDGGPGTDSRTIIINNVAPTAAITGAPTSASEGSSISLGSSFSDPGSADTFTHAWSVTKNGSAYATGSAASFNFTPDDNGSYVVTLTVTDDDGGAGSDSSTILVNNLAPTAAINGAPASSPEGTPISLTSSFSDPGSADSFTHAWSVTKNGLAYSSGSGSNFSFTPNDNGAYVVSLTVTDDDGGAGVDTRTITVTNAAPTVSLISGPATGQQGASQTFTSAFTDPGSADTWNITWNFGDGSSQSSPGSPGAISASHTYLAAGTYAVSVTVGDDDDGSGSQSSSITISSTSTTTLQINGTPGDDDISVKPGAGGTLLVEVNGLKTSYSGITRLIITAGAGNDKVKVNHDVAQNVVVFAGAGDDSIKTGDGDDIIIGGDGDDLMHGNDGRDLLIGGNDRDRIVGNADSDILVAGFTQHDSNLAALDSILSEWTSSRSYGLRTANVVGRDVLIHGVLYVFGGPRLNGNNFLTPDGIDATVFDDFQVDILTGSAGQDLFLFNNDCPIQDILNLSNNEFAADIDFLAAE